MLKELSKKVNTIQRQQQKTSRTENVLDPLDVILQNNVPFQSMFPLKTKSDLDEIERKIITDQDFRTNLVIPNISYMYLISVNSL